MPNNPYQAPGKFPTVGKLSQAVAPLTMAHNNLLCLQCCQQRLESWCVPLSSVQSFIPPFSLMLHGSSCFPFFPQSPSKMLMIIHPQKLINLNIDTGVPPWNNLIFWVSPISTNLLGPSTYSWEWAFWCLPRTHLAFHFSFKFLFFKKTYSSSL